LKCLSYGFLLGFLTFSPLFDIMLFRAYFFKYRGYLTPPGVKDKPLFESFISFPLFPGLLGLYAQSLFQTIQPKKGLRLTNQCKNYA
jgi:hypothetical protein